MKNLVLYHGKYLSLILLLLSMVLVTFSSGCFEGEEALKVSLEKTEALEKSDTKNESVRIGVFSMASPKMTAEYYQGFLAYLSGDTGINFELVQRDNPNELTYLLETKYLDAVFLREDDYLKGHDDFGMELVAVPVIHGDVHYFSYVITRSDDGIESLADLHNKKFAFNTYRFNQGEVVPEYMQVAINESPDSFFSSYIYSNSQDNFIDMVFQGSLDGAEIDCTMWEYVVEDSIDYSSSLQIIYKSPPQLAPVIAVNPEINMELKEKIKTSLLKMHDSPEGRTVLKNMQFNMFVEMDYDTYAVHQR